MHTPACTQEGLFRLVVGGRGQAAKLAQLEPKWPRDARNARERVAEARVLRTRSVLAMLPSASGLPLGRIFRLRDSDHAGLGPAAALARSAYLFRFREPAVCRLRLAFPFARTRVVALLFMPCGWRLVTRCHMAGILLRAVWQGSDSETKQDFSLCPPSPSDGDRECYYCKPECKEPGVTTPLPPRIVTVHNARELAW